MYYCFMLHYLDTLQNFLLCLSGYYQGLQQYPGNDLLLVSELKIAFNTDGVTTVVVC